MQGAVRTKIITLTFFPDYDLKHRSMNDHKNLIPNSLNISG